MTSLAETQITVKSMDKWTEQDPYDTYHRSPFKATAFKTQRELARELDIIDARNIVLYTMHPPHAIRRDGWVKADRQPPHPGVILEFEKPAGENQWVKLRFPCNTFGQWEENLRAIALALEALRKIDRYGVVTGAQYAGFKALPPAEEGTEGQTAEQAAEFIAKSAGMPDAGGQVLTNPVFGDLAYKTAAKLLHPDRGGDEKQFAKLEGSMRLVRDSYGEEAKSAGGGA